MTISEPPLDSVIRLASRYCVERVECVELECIEFVEYTIISKPILVKPLISQPIYGNDPSVSKRVNE